MNDEEEKAVIVEEAARESKRPRGRRLIIGLSVLCLFLLLATAFLAWKLLYTPTQQQAQAGTDLAAQVQAACDDPRQDTKTLKNLCSDANDVVDDAPATVQGPPGDTGPQGDQGVTGDTGPAPSTAEIRLAVNNYCSNFGCRGANGQDATASQVAAAVALYCDSRGQCRGQSGADGKDGADGANGADGNSGPPPTDAQVLEAVSNYCGENRCRGEQGPRGEQGATGETGPVGPQGPPGPTCPSGYTGREFTVETGTGPLNDDTQAIFACVPDGSEASE